MARAEIKMFTSEDIELENYLGSQGFLNISSYQPGSSSGAGGYGEDLGLSDVQQLGSQDLSEGEVSVRLYTGKIVRGELSGSRVVLKAYPSSRISTADAMAANELASHAALQPPCTKTVSPYLVELMGGFAVTSGASAGEQWLVFKNDGVVSAAQYAAAAGQATEDGQALGEAEFWDRFDPSRVIARRQTFILSVMRQVFCGLSTLHANFRLHQSLGPYSVVMDRAEERDARATAVKLRDLGFGVDVSDSALYGGLTLGEIWDGASKTRSDPVKELSAALWARARQEGAYSELERRNFGFADDVYAAGLLMAFMAFVPLCPPGSVDGPSLQRLLESTFRLDIEAFRDYADADERWQKAVAFLDTGGGAGWDLLTAMLNPDWRRRPTAESCLNHPFMRGQPLAEGSSSSTGGGGTAADGAS